MLFSEAIGASGLDEHVLAGHSHSSLLVHSVAVQMLKVKPLLDDDDI